MRNLCVSARKKEMKGKFIIFCAMALSCLCVVSCEKTGADRLAGSYTYKISGSVTLAKTSDIQAQTVVMQLVTEQGQMNIAKDNSSNGVMVSWNDIAGDAYHTMATVDGNTISLKSAAKNATVKDGLLSYDGVVTYWGEGELYDNMLIIHLDYRGEFTIGGSTYTIVSSENVECVAKAN